ncbi:MULTISPECIES: DUF2268 domain-containing putative Zn-dependent protease [unclassified Chryseobacterium]|uniref:gliding motility protein GldB-related protein n=1 Tax=unclassified Chryseobacterium TaxID=2593645 RepID=UPI00100BA5B0|nr:MULTISPECIES: DUF2268 domain-containing putative Zn-dependent protease [unclassified Chryseobacterium]RXM52612.1 hypothetical protein BOQ64_07070 [Chryseobacterium sp. CH25]RXM66667.1 hypothetical protein BOQ60_01540 [Chryseobacterium sp. CH1]
MKHIFCLLFMYLFTVSVNAQKQDFTIYIETSDIKNFWVAYDEVLKMNNQDEKISAFQKLYVDKGSLGLNDFIKSRNFTAEQWIESFESKPNFWNSIRIKTEHIQKDFKNIEHLYQNFTRLYEGFSPPKIYFTMGNLKGGGTVINGNLIIGSELAASDKTVDYSELSKNYQDRMKINSGITFLTAHELVHTQQNLRGAKTNLLGFCLKEGSADFIAELLTGKKVEAPYIEYGMKHQGSLWNNFQKEMNGEDFQNWLSNTATIKDMPADLGYFIGYIITKKFYERSKDKKSAVSTIINLDFSNTKDTENFLKQSEYKTDIK